MPVAMKELLVGEGRMRQVLDSYSKTCTLVHPVVCMPAAARSDGWSQRVAVALLVGMS